MNERIRHLRQSLNAFHRKRSGRRSRYPAEMRSEVVAAVRALDQPIARTARELGVSVFTLHDWLRRDDPGIKPVVMVERPPTGTPVSLVTPTGYRVEGLDEGAVLRILRALS